MDVELAGLGDDDLCAVDDAAGSWLGSAGSLGGAVTGASGAALTGGTEADGPAAAEQATSSKDKDRRPTPRRVERRSSFMPRRRPTAASGSRRPVVGPT